MRFSKRMRSVLSIVLTAALLFAAVLFPVGVGSAAAYAASGPTVEINISDVLKVLSVCVDLETAEAASPLFMAADLDRDGRITSADARMLLRTKASQASANPSAEQMQMRYNDLSGHVMQYVEYTAMEGRLLYTGPFYRCIACGRHFSDPMGVVPVHPESLAYPVSGALAQACDQISMGYRAAGVQVAVIRGGCVTDTYTYGMADISAGRALNENTKYRVASLSKVVTAMLFMRLAELGLVSETEDISAYFGYYCRNPYFPDTVITPRMLLTHTASLECEGRYELYYGALATDEFYLNVRPGTEANYSNIGYAILGCICEIVTGRYLNDLANEYIFEPLGIDASYLAYRLRDPSNLGALYGEDAISVAEQLEQRERPLGAGLTLAQGGLTVSAKDYAAILSVLLNGGLAPDGTRILSEESVRKMETVWAREGDFELGYGMYRQDDVFANKTVYTHTGSAYGMFSAYLLCPEDRAGVVVLTSGCDGFMDETSQIYSVCLDFIRTVYPR